MRDKLNGFTAGLAAFLVNGDDFWDDFTTFLHIEHVALMDVQLADDVGIVQGGALDDGAAQQHGVQIGYRCNDTRASHLEGHILQLGAFPFRSELVGNRPAWRFGSGS